MEDMISLLPRDEVQAFIASNENSDVQQLLLKHKEILGLPAPWMAQQIQGRKKAKEKLPLWYNTKGIIYPPTVNLEQSSSQATATYRQGLGGGNHAADICGGYGVDAYFLSKVFSQIDFVEPDGGLIRIAQHNHLLLGATNIRYHNMTAEDFLKKSSDPFDCIFVDPSRRKESQKLVHLKDCVPDVTAMRPLLLRKAHRIMIKSSPLLDLKQAHRELKEVAQFIVLASGNECRELLIVLTHESTGEPLIHAVELNKQGITATFTFTRAQEKEAKSTFSTPHSYLYEPNPAILKAGAFRLIGERYALSKLAPDTHLYTSDKFDSGFPGRVFRVIGPVTLDKKLRGKFKDGYANILTRNYPLSVNAIKKKTGLEEGGSKEYLICMRADRPMVVIAERLK